MTPPAHEHTYGDWSKDETNHWHECTAEDCRNKADSIKDTAAHVYDNDTDTSCNTCGYERTVTPPAHERTYHTIRASVNANGSITPSGTISVREGSDQTFTITPDQGYDVADVKIDGKSIGVVRSYTFEKIKGSHTIEVKIDREEVIKQAKAKELTASIVLTARSVKTAKKNVKVRLEMDAESAAAIRELQALGYTVKYKFYRSEKKAGQYEAKLTKTSKAYINTQGEKGKRYYYKARVLIYDPSGKPVTYSKLTQCKYAARLWTK